MKLIHGMTPIEFDKLIASKYLAKIKNASERNIDFCLTYSQYRKLFTRSLKCAYTNEKMTIVQEAGQGGYNLPSNYATLERIDGSKGYVDGNCVLITFEANQIKAVFENPVKSTFGVDRAIIMFSNISKLKNKQIENKLLTH